MTATIYQDMMRQLRPIMHNPVTLQQRVDKLFPGVIFEIVTNRQTGEPLIKGLSPDQLRLLFDDTFST